MYCGDIYCKALLSTVHILSKKDCECNHTMIDAIKMDRIFLLLLGLFFQHCFCALTKNSEITATFRDVDRSSSDVGFDRSANPAADLDVLMKNLFKATKLLHSDIRKWIHHARRDKASDPEPILEEVFEPMPSHKSKEKHHCDQQDKTKRKKIYKAQVEKPLKRRQHSSQYFRHKQRLKSEKNDRVSSPPQTKHNAQQQMHKAQAQNMTQEEMDALLAEMFRQNFAWAVREKDGHVYVSDRSELDNIYRLNSNIFLPYTYHELKSQTHTKELMDDMLGLDKLASNPITKPEYFANRIFGSSRITVPMDKLAEQPYSSIGIVQLKNSHCTGTFIGPRHILTAANCIYGNNEWQDLRFTLGKYCDTNGGVVYDWVKLIVPLRWINQRSQTSNYGMIVVNPVTPSHTVMDFGWHDKEVPYNNVITSMMLISYPLDDPKQCMQQDFCYLKTDEISTLLEHDCVSSKGDIGAPIFSPFTGADRIVICIDSYWQVDEAKQRHYCQRIIKPIFASLVRWIDIY